MGGSTPAVVGQAQQQGSFTSGEPYHFLAQYKEVSCSRGPWVCTIHEEDARRHLADIEKTVADQLIHNILELKLIHDIKEADFSIRGEHQKGLYFKDALPSVTAVKTSLFNAFLQLQDITQQMIQEQIVELKIENLRLSEALRNLTKELLENKPLTKRQLEDLILKITEKPKQIEQQALQLSEELKQKATNSYKEALQATEGIEAPAVGFCKPADYKGGISSNNILIKQANTQIQLLVTILEKLESLEERVKKLEAKEAPAQQTLPDEIIKNLSKRIKAISIRGTCKNYKVMATQNREPPVTTITRTRTEGAPLFEDQVREYRQGQRRKYNAQRAMQRVARRVTGGSYNNALEQQLDPQTQLRLSMQERASIVPAEVLYHSRRDDVHHRVYVHRSEEAILVTSNQVDRAFIQPESFNQLQRSGMRFLHMGVIQVRIQILHRQEEGTLALVVFRDNRWQGDQAIFATMEIDLTHGSQLVYVIPDTMLTISDFYRNIQVSILARGYENWRNGEANLLITRGLVGRLSNTPNVGFAYEIQNVVDYLASHGVRALPGRSYNTRDVEEAEGSGGVGIRAGGVGGDEGGVEEDVGK
ncbi:hypothetical protein ZIOFF_057040 [Zingiber officinale]|uniref:Uncharacterized protein n=1 Tax=Zingiber officinale TaxID=94328 RepID=A0A8J5FIY1_ZINOF|nr:hypothetical protein ZIOFF_057040 [Zingiber officinale]